MLRRLLSPFEAFVRGESFGGLVLIAVSGAAFAWASSPWHGRYEALLELPLGLRLGGWAFETSLHHVVNDGLMTLFFLLVGLEIKRELRVGELRTARAAALPAIAALGGMVVPAAIYAGFNAGGPGSAGWGIPMATDIAFALGVMALLGPRVPLGLKVFLTALAIVDDLGAVVVIALFYTSQLDVGALLAALALWGLLLVLGRRGVRSLAVYLLIGLAMWVFMLRSGVHATVAGVLLALAVPLDRRLDPKQLPKRLAGLVRGSFEEQEVQIEQLEELLEDAQTPLHTLEHALAPWVAFGIVPVFAFFNAGLHLSGDARLATPVTLGIALGLFAGKLLGVAGSSWLAVRLGVAALPEGVGTGQLLGAALLAGIGFTMSLFIAGLAFPDPALLAEAKLGIFSASLVSAVAGLAVLGAATRRRA